MAKLYFRYGAMNSGKTTMLLQTAHNYEEQGMKIFLIKPLIDTKGNDKVVSRLGIERKVDLQLETNDHIEIPYHINAIIVDEAQFLTTQQIDELYTITKERDIPVLAYGLRCDFQMKGFPGATRLLQIADDITELKTICDCGKKATQNLRMLNNIPTFKGNQVAIDNNSTITYKSVCGKCYLRLRREYEEL